ncbi:MAG: TolC family protein [Cyclobacteriaceae bacterium]|nr:TolC family protein [Cyclobacteriaceae bacterium]
MKRILALIFMAASWQSYGQDSFNLDQCIDYALKNAVPIKNAELDERIATARVKETVGIGLPQIDGTVSVDHNNRLRRFFSLYDPNSIFFGGQTIPGAEVGDVISAQNFFQLKSSADAGVRINQLLFNGSYLVGLQAANAYKDLSIKSSTQTKEEVVANVSKAYYAVLVNRERIKSFDNNIGRVESLLKDTRAMFENGFAESIDVDRIRVSLNNLITERSKFQRLQELSLELLKFQINYPMEQTLTIEGELTDRDLDVDVNSFVADWSYTERPDYQVLLANKKLQQLNVKNNFALGVPSLSAYANMGYSTQSPNVGGLFKTNTNIDDIGPVGPDKWYPYMSIGVSLNVPIFSGLQRSYKIQQEKLTLQKIENGERQLKSNIDLQIKEAISLFTNSKETLQWQQENSDLASKVANVTRIKYAEGVGSNFEVVEAETTLRESQINYFNALFDALVAKVDLEKAYGKLWNENKK